MEEVDKKYDNLFFNEELIKESEKLPIKIKLSLEKGKIEENDWNNKQKTNALVHDCINIENNIKNINIINEKIKKFNSIKDFEVKFEPEEDGISEISEKVKNFGHIYYNELEKNV